MKHKSRKAFELKPVPSVWPSKKFNGIALIGEAPGENEAREGVPFIGGAGQVLNGLLEQTDIDREASYVGNVFTSRPPENKIKHFFITKSDADFEPRYALYPPNGYLRPEHYDDLERLRLELERLNPNVVVALGATALWALTGQCKIGKLRGAPIESTLVPGLKVIPTYHPAAIMRNWDFRPITGADLIKAKRESAFPEIKRITREIWIEPNLDDLLKFERKYMLNPKMLSVDIETDPWKLKQITCVGIAPDEEHALVVPFVDHRKKGWSYWNSADEEKLAWSWIAKWLKNPEIKKLGQNYAYDMMWFWKYGVENHGKIEDTMLLHHALQPELPKGLDVLGSMYTNEVSWKTMVSFKKQDMS